MSVAVVIPARGGSKGIPRKNMRLMNGKPLIAYAIENALASRYVDKVLVSSDSEEVLAFASQYDNVLALGRESRLAQDAVTLDPVVYDAISRCEADGLFDVVVTLQPTSPLLSVETLDAALAYFLSSELDTLISVVNNPHLSWMEDSSGRVFPAYEKRLNRQQLPRHYVETGAFLVSRRECVTPAGRLGNSVGVFEVPEAESTDIDTRKDWVVCESLLARRSIVFRVDGHRQLGLGHVFRALTLSYSLTEHEVTFVCDARYREGIDKLRASNMPVVEIENEAHLLSWLDEKRPDIYIHDCLDTEIEFVREVKKRAGRVVTFEDLGDGAREADAVVNAIYEDASPHHNVYTGKSYVALRDEFLIAKPRPFSETVRRILVLFGGTDPLDLTSKIYELARTRNESNVDITFDFILGSGYAGDGIVSLPECGIRVMKDVVRVSDYMREADMAISSQGRTTFELASLGVPTIVLAQNDRERLHRFAQMDNGFINLGLGSEVSDADIASTLEWLIGAVSVRREMRRLMLENDLKSGIKRVKRIILGESL